MIKESDGFMILCRYKNKLSDKTKLLDVIIDIEKREGTITLVYSARDDKHNNAVVLREVLEERRG